MDILGLRIPDYSKQPAKRRAYWDWLQSVSTQLLVQPFVLMGDFNTDPAYPRARCGDRIRAMQDAGWQHACPAGGASFWTTTGHAVRIDHAFASSHFRLKHAEYLPVVNGRRIVGSNALSDHAPLVVELERQ